MIYEERGLKGHKLTAGCRNSRVQHANKFVAREETIDVVHTVLYCTGYTVIKTVKLRCAATLTSKLCEMGEGNKSHSSLLGSPPVLLNLQEPKLC